MFLFFQFLCHIPQTNWNNFSILFVSQSHCNTQIFCLMDLGTVTNKICISSKKMPKKVKMLHYLVLFALFGTLCAFLALVIPFYFFFFLIVDTFCNFLCSIYPFCFLQWLSVTNNVPCLQFSFISHPYSFIITS